MHNGCELFHEGCREAGEVEVMGVKEYLVVHEECGVFHVDCRETGAVEIMGVKR